MAHKKKTDGTTILPFPTASDAAPAPRTGADNQNAPAQDGEKISILRTDWERIIQERDAAIARVKILEEMSLINPKTGLGNEKALELDFKTEQERQERRLSKGAVLLAIDLNGLKAVNDKCGHGEGDSLIQNFGSILRKNMRNERHAYHVSGDEFFVLLEDADLSDAYKFIKRVRENCARDPFQTTLIKAKPEKSSIAFTISFGVGAEEFSPKSDFGRTKEKADVQMITDKKIHGVPRGKLPSLNPAA